MSTTPAMNRSQSLRLMTFVTAVVIVGGMALADSIAVLRQSPLNGYAVLLAVLTIASGRFVIKMPGRPATVSVSEVFVFTSILLFGYAAATLTVALDGIWVSLTQKNRRLYRTLFNVAEPAVSTWMAAHVFFAVARGGPEVHSVGGAPIVAVATVVMAAVFFAFNSGLTAIAIALETPTSAYAVWRRHATYLAVNYYAAASLATLAVGQGGTINFGVAGLVVPLLILSYVAYREASTRVQEADRHIAEVEHLYQAAVEMLAIAVDAKDQVTHGHIRRVQRHTLAVAQALGVTEKRDLRAIEAGALLHDIGKLAVPDYVLNKPTELTRAEYESMKKHASMGARILTAVDFPYPIVPIVRHHHERWDGRGYPDGLAGTEIPLGARIIAVVDCFDALTSERPYRPKLSDHRAVEMIRARTGSFYDPTVVETFVALVPRLREQDRSFADASDSRSSVIAGLARTVSGHGPRANAGETGTLVAAAHRIASFLDVRIGRMGGDAACLFAVDATADMLVAACATPRLRDVAATRQIPFGAGVSGWVAGNRSTIRRANATLDLGELAQQLDLRSCTSTPVFVEGELFGVLTVYTASDTGLTERAIAAVGTAAQEIGLILAQTSSEHHTRPTILEPRAIAAAS